ncbi:MAG TPA: SDR family NAD(P)-dependent oxidoreductase [Syntrophales bacterium]|nr:SDR family NAD(P)-dependent oxidoreductase [Syntrophales bacterium]HPQ43632.1 SDR family NAD(P)-dependent oxidoreductase [Syntrophales bacterium]
MIDLKGKVAVVTGGSRGIGKGICEVLAEQGANIAILDILEQDGNQTAAELSAKNVKAAFYNCDVTNKEKVDADVAQIIKDFGQIDILVNDAGFDKIELFLKLDPKWWDKLIDLNYKHFIYTNHAVLPHMVERKTGRIVNIGSDAGRGGSTGEAVYSGAKGAVIAFTKTIAREFARFQITSNCVCPGPTVTPMTIAQADEEFAGKINRAVEGAIPLRRLGQPRDIANAVAFFASEEAGYITGQVLSVSGGLTMF